ncbi:MAG TPA: hypothetical protein DD426_07595 [Clostridiaceae bacterium]|nr:hypothetical protein [Clostridiaceae bacterium]
MESVNVRDFGALGDGIKDDKAAIQAALDSGCPAVYIPDGTYRICGTLKIGSHSHIFAGPSARLVVSSSFPKRRGDFLISNSDIENGNIDISIKGGIWDGNFDGKNNTKDKDLFNPNASSGATMNFVNVKGLVLQDLTVANSVTYYIRMCRIDDFRISGIGFSAKRLAFNQDGLHFAGGCRNGVVENIRAITNGETNDDMIALNADDSVERIENLDLVCDSIENISFKNIYADNCYTAIRMLSIRSSIRNIIFEDVYAGCRTYAINMDAARYCRTPLFDEREFPEGVGCIDNVSIKNLKIYSTNPKSHEPLICGETLADHFSIENMERLYDKDANPDLPTAKIKNVSGTTVDYKTDDKLKSIFLNKHNDCIIINDEITSLYINRKK